MTTMRTELGWIQKIRLGHDEDHRYSLGLFFELGGHGWGVQSQWYARDQVGKDKMFNERVSDLLKEARVSDIAKLQGVPVEAIFDGNVMQSWRILTEVVPS